MSDTNIVESILEAMEIVSTKNVNKIMFDKTIECEIIDNSDSKNGHYRVSDGSSKFDAYSEKTSYAKGSKVLVKIPQGDFSGKKYIEGLVEKEGGESITYLSALNTIMDIVELTKKEPVKYLDSEDKFSLIANGEEKKKLIWSFDFTDPKNQNIWLDNIYSSFYVEADFKTALNNVKKGTYGLYFEVTIRLANGNLLTQYYNLNSTEFFGNPYKFSIYTNQSKKFNIKNLRRFETIELYFSQGGDFKNIDGTDYSNSSKTPDLFVKNIRVGLGSDLVDIPDNNLKLITLDSLEFGTTETTYTIPVGLDYFWFNKSEENKYLGFSDGVAEVRLTGQQTVEYDKLKNNECGTKIIYNNNNNNIDMKEYIINMREYDEIKYLKLVADETRVKNQKNSNMPPDEQSLKLMADIQDVHNILIGIKLLLDKDYKNLLTTFKNNMPQEFSTDENIDINSYNLDTSLLDKYLNKPLKNTDNSINTQASFLEFYKNVFKYIAAVYTSLKNNLPDETKEIERKIPKDWIKMDDLTDYGMDELDDYGMIDLRKTFLDDYMGKIEIILGDKEVSVNGGLFEDKLKIKYSNYIKYYNNFKTEVKKIKTLLNNYYKKIEEKLPDFKLLNFSWSVEEDEKNKTEFKPLYTFTINGKTYNNDYYLTKDGKLNVTEWTESSYNIFDNLYCIYWYRFENDYEDLDDPFGEKGWKRISSENLFTEYKKDINSQDYVFIGTNASTSPIINLGLPNKTNDEWIDNKKHWSIEDSAENKASLSIVLNPQNIEEKFKVILIYNHEQFESNELIFNNINHPNNQNIITDGVLNIVHQQNSQDHYPFYNGSSKQLLNSNDAYTERQIRAEYELSEEETLNGYIYWYFPSNKTQLEFSNNLDGFIKKEAYKLANKAATYQYNEEKSEFNLIKKDDNANIVYEENYEKVYEISSEKEKDGYYEIDKEKNIWIKKYDLKQTYLPGEDGYVCFSKRLSEVKKEGLNEALAFPYRIKNSYDINNSKNLIKCQLILDNGTKKEGNKGFSFSLFGSNGTDYTLVVRPANIMKTTVKDKEALVLKAEVYGKSGEIFSDAKFNVKWVNPNGHEEFGVTSYSCKNDGNSFEIEVNDLTKSRYGILKIIATIKDNGAEINLDTLYAIPWSANDAFYQLSGPTGVTYNSHGTLMNYDKTAYSLFVNGNIENATIEIIYRDSDLKSDYEKDNNEVDMSSWLPKLGIKDQARILFPPPLYIEDIGIYPYIQATVNDEIKFIQPLTIEQDRFESTFLNKWDGSLQIDKDNNTIMSAMVGAGKKDDNNTFSGVLMGQVEGKTGIAESGIGLYGFHQGGQSFGFNIDGTAFLGKSGSGRIEFDGNNSLIRSALWNGKINNDGEIIIAGTQGMAISLKTGHIDAHAFKLTSENIKLNSGNFVDENNPYLFVGDGNSFIEFTSTGGLKIKVTSFSLTGNALDETVTDALDGIFISDTELNRNTMLDRLLAEGDGIYLGKDGKLYIVADAIATGHLKSIQKTNGIPNMTINMDTGHIDAYNFKLTGGGDSLCLNSNPSNSTDYYFKIEKGQSYLHFTQDGALQLNLNGPNSSLFAKDFELDALTTIIDNTNINLDYWEKSAKFNGGAYQSLQFKVEAQICLEISTGSLEDNYSEAYTSGGWKFIGENWRSYLTNVKNNENGNYNYSIKLYYKLENKDSLPILINDNNDITPEGWKFLKLTVYNIKNIKKKSVSQEDSRMILRLGSNLETDSFNQFGLKFNPNGFEIYRQQKDFSVNWDQNYEKYMETIFSANAYGASGIFNSLIFRGDSLVGPSLPEGTITITDSETGVEKTINLQDGLVFFLLEETEQ